MTDKPLEVLIAEIRTNMVNLKEQMDAILTNQENIFQEQGRHGKAIEALRGDVQRIVETNDLKLQAVSKDIQSLKEEINRDVKDPIKKNTDFRHRLEGVVWILEKTPLISIVSALMAFAALLYSWVKSNN